LKWAYNEFFEGKKPFFSQSQWQEQSGIIFRATSGISLIAATSEISSSNSQRSGTAICSGSESPRILTTPLVRKIHAPACAIKKKIHKKNFS
jgi:hypothetical protein